MTRRVSSRRAAQLLGVATKTLANWRMRGEGPKGWVRIGKTLVVYAVAEIEEFLRSKEESGARLGRPGLATARQGVACLGMDGQGCQGHTQEEGEADGNL